MKALHSTSGEICDKMSNLCECTKEANAGVGQWRAADCSETKRFFVFSVCLPVSGSLVMAIQLLQSALLHLYTFGFDFIFISLSPL